MKKRVVSLLLCLIMALSLIPTVAFAAEASSQDDGISLTSIRPPDDQSYYYYTYKFYNGSSSTPISTQTVKQGDVLYQPETPQTEEGKVFIGWYENDTPFTGFGKVSDVTETKTIRVDAKFEDGYHVYFKDNNGRIIATKTGKTDDKITFEKVIFAVGTDEAITGWYTDKDCTSGNQVESVTIEYSNITLYAKVEKGHWITFDSDGGSYVEPKFFATSANTKEPTAPTKSGYDFAGWYNGETKYTFGSKLDESITLKAHWTAQDGVPYTVIHWQENVDDAKFSFMDSETMTGTTGELTKAAAKSCDGFNVRGIEQKTIAGDGSTIVNVFYERNEYTINFWPTNGSTLSCRKEEHTHSWWQWCYNLRGKLTCTKEEHTHDSSCYETRALFTITAKYGANISNQWPARDNGSTNWSTKRGGDGPYQAGIDVMPLGGGNFYVPRSESSSSASASYYVEVLEGKPGTEVVRGKTYTLHHTDTVMMSRPYITWDEDFYNITGFTRNEIDSTPNRGRYNGAKFYYYRNSYEIKFINGSNVENTVSKQYEADISDVSYTPTTAPTGKEGYRFVAWYDNELCEGTPYVFTGKTMPAKNITVYAKWMAPTYKVTVYDQNGNSLGDFTVSQGETVIGKMPAVTVGEDETFLGWVQDSPNGNPFTLTTEIHRDYSLYAKVGSTAKYTVTYDGNGGTGSVTDSEKYGKGAFATVKANDFTKDNMVFLGWSTTASGSVAYYANSKLEITGNMTLYAIWGDKDSTVTLTYNANYEGAVPATREFPSLKNNALVQLAAASLFPREDYELTGWNTKADGSGTSFAAGSNARVNKIGENVLYAQWERQTGSLTITKVVSAPEGVTVPDSFTFNVSGYSEPVTVTAVDNWTKTITVNAGTYTVTENTSTVPGGYKLDTTYAPENRTVTVNAGAIANVTVTNTYTKVFGADIVNPASLTVFKKDARTDALLSGAEFQLLKKVGNDYVAVGIPVGTTSSGMITFTALEPGDYQLKETKAPANYVGWTDHTFAFTVVKNDEPTDAARYNETTKQFEKVYDCHIVLTSDLDEGFQDFYKNYSFANNELTVYNEKIGGKEIEVKKIVKAPYAPVGETEFTFYVTLGYDNNTSVFEDVELLSDFHIYFKAKGADTAKELTLDDMENRYSFTMKASSDKIGEGTLILTGTQNDLDRLAVSVWEDGDEAPENWEYADEPCVAILTYDKESNDYLLLNEDEEPVTVPFTFTNTYTKVVTDVTAKFNVEKLVERQRGSRKPGKADFTFEAYYTNNEGKLVKIDQNLTISTNGVDKYTSSWNLVVPAAAFNDNGVASLTIKEVNSRKTGWTYDKTEYKLVVTQDGKVDRLANPLAAVEVDPDAALTLSFINTYYKRSGGGGGGDKPIQSVKTGDMGIAMYAMTSLLSLGGAALVIKKRKEEK